MPREDERQRQLPPQQTGSDEFAAAYGLLKDPAQVAPVDATGFGKRLSEIIMRALRLHRSRKGR